MCGILKKKTTNELIYKTKIQKENKQRKGNTDKENKLMVTNGERGRIGGWD